MRIKINGIEQEVENLATLSDVLTNQNYINKPGIAVAVNSSVVPKLEWNRFKVTENDTILIISATKGG